jgi:GTP cyclohydrolase I
MIDLQNKHGTYIFKINQVGIKDLVHPIMVTRQDNSIQHTIGTFSLFVALASTQRATHMSRFIEIVNQQDWILSCYTNLDLAQLIANKLESKSSYIKIAFNYFINKTAPVSKVPGLLDYKVNFIAEITATTQLVKLEVTVPVKTLCPCSKAISQYGAHNQRSNIFISAQLNLNTPNKITIEDLIKVAEQSASSEIYSVLKREDEKYITEYAYNNPKFVEDLVRDIAKQLSQDPRILNFTISAENFESIHNHSAYALITNR